MRQKARQEESMYKIIKSLCLSIKEEKKRIKKNLCETNIHDEECVKNVICTYEVLFSRSSSKNMYTLCTNWDTEMLSTVYFCILGIRQGRTFVPLSWYRLIRWLRSHFSRVALDWSGWMGLYDIWRVSCCGWPNNLSCE